MAGLVAVLGAIEGCSAPSIPGHDDLAFGDDASGKKSKGSQGEDSPEGTQQDSIELGQGTKSSEPPPEADRTKGDEGANDAPAGTCTLDAECNQSGRICTAGACVKGCRNSAGCGASETCTAGQCALSDASVECLADFDCDYGTICIASQCIDGCYTSYDCPVGQGCTAGQCKVTTTTSTPPAGGGGSVGGGTPCSSDGQCNPGLNGSGQICGAQGTCVAGCHRDNQCPGTKICVSGSCR